MSILKFEHYFWDSVFGVFFFFLATAMKEFYYMYEPKKKSSLYDAIR
jgi:hypothetical protein